MFNNFSIIIKKKSFLTKGWVLLFLLFFLQCIRIRTQANFSQYKESLENIGVSTSLTREKQILYRNDVVRLLSTIQCNDCLHPDKAMIDEYNSNRWSNFITLPWNNFDDVLRDNYYRQSENYYYCVAQAAKKWIVNGYPRDISPFCPGRFCWVNYVKQWELIQIIFNLIKQNPKKLYSINRKSVKSRLNNKNTSIIAQKNFSIEDRAMIEKKSNECSNNCRITSPEEFDIYAKYCTRNLWSCSMIDFSTLREWQRPIAELNILLKEEITNIIQADKLKPYEPANSQQLLEYLYSAQEEASCAFDTDYDNDSILNHLDNCSIVRNPSQRNLDNDKFGDVCDNDIDWDGILDPQWLINEYGFINSFLYGENKKNYDNCPTTPNIDQSDKNANLIWDACENTNNGSSLSIQSKVISELNWKADLNFSVVFEWKDCGSGYSRNFGNGNRGYGKTINQEFQPGEYDIWVIDCNNNIAYTSISINTNKKNIINKSIENSLQIKTNPNSGPNGFTTTATPEYSGDCSSIQWWVDGKRYTQTQWSSSANIIISWYGSHSIEAFCIDDIKRINKAVAKTQVHVINPNKKDNQSNSSAQLSASPLQATIWTPIRFKTKTEWFLEKDIKTMVRDFWDNSYSNEKSPNIIHIYNSIGTKVVRQNITLNNNKKIENILQILIKNKPDITTSDDKKNNFIANLKTSPSIWKINDIVNIELQTQQEKSIKNIQWAFGDGESKKSNNLNEQHRYLKAWSYIITAIVELYNGEQKNYGNQIQVNTSDLCLEWVNNQKKNKTQCDKDADGIVDLCDDDLDGDWVKNPIGLVLFDNKNCALNEENLNPSILNNPDPKTDNCPQSPNGKQENKDNDAFWDVCDKQPNTPNTNTSPDADSDNDGIPNNLDPDSADGDNDGIPNYLDNLSNTPISNTIPNNILQWNPLSNFSNPIQAWNAGSIIQNNCSSCPCWFTQTLSPISAWDIIYSNMKYEWGYTKSNNFEVK